MHQCRQGIGCGRRSKRMQEQNRGEAYCLVAKVSPNRTLRRSPMVAFVKQQVQRALHSRKAGGKLSAGRHVEELLRRREYFFRPRYSLFDRRVRAYKGPGYLADTESTENIEHERNLRLLAQARMTAGKHHPE